MDPNATGQMTPGATPPPPPPEWAVTPPAPSSGSGVGTAVGGAVARRLLGLIGSLAIVAVLIVGYVVYQKVANPDHLGQVIYTTVDQNDVSNCSISSQVSSTKVGTSVYALYVLQHHVPIDQEMTEGDFKDGVSLGTYTITHPLPDADCLWTGENLNASFTTPGSYEIKVTVGQEVIADGKLTVTP
jgi:hypothetical protein